MINDEFYYLDQIKDTYEYSLHYITDFEEYKIDRVMENMYDRKYGKYFKIVLYLNGITYVNELMQGLALKIYDMESVINFMNSVGFNI